VLYHSGLPVEVFIRIIALDGDAGLCAVVPLGITSDPVLVETSMLLAVTSNSAASNPISLALVGICFPFYNV
jgi:hypothetical protein